MAEARYALDAVALVTGASGGIGAAVATALADAGCRVVVTARRLGALERLVSSIGPAAHALRLDVTDAAAVAALPETLPADFRDIGILVNNAAHDVGGRTRFDQSAADEMTRVVDTNLSGVIRVTRALVPHMLARGSGDIVNIGSVNTLRTSPSMSAYTAGKAGLHGLTEVLRADFAALGLRVIEVVPGLTRTDFARTRFRGDAQKAATYFERFKISLTPEEVADAVLYALARPRHVNIAQIVVTPATHW